MKRILCIVLLLTLTACGAKPTPQTPLETADGDYTLEQAKAERCVVFEDSVIAAGQDVWDAFVKSAQDGKKASVRFVNYYTLDETRCSPEYYESAKDDYPKPFTEDLSYDGEAYTLRYYDEGEEYTETYQYLKRFDEYPYTNTPAYRMVIYMLLNDETVTYSDFMRSIASSDSRTPRVEGAIVYYTLVYDKVLQGETYSNDPDSPSDRIHFDLQRKIFTLNHDMMDSMGTLGFFTIENEDTIRCVSNDGSRTYLFRILDNETIAYIREDSDELGFLEPLQDGAEFKRTAD